MSASPLARLSALRQEIAVLLRVQGQILRPLLRERGPLVRGAFARQGRRCGRSGCHCAQGTPHDAAVLTCSEQGHMRTTFVPRPDRARVEAAAGRYREFRRSRARLVRLAQQLVRLLDALQGALTEPYSPPSRPAKRRSSSSRRR